MPNANIDPVQASAPTTGLVASSARPSGDTRWTQGMSWRPEICFDVAGVPHCDTHMKPVGVLPDVVHYMPQSFFVDDECTTLSDRVWQDTADRVRRQVAAATSFVTAREFWGGAITRRWPDAVNGENSYLADGNATLVSGTFATVVEALAALETAALDATHGQRVFLHVSPEWVPYLRDMVRREGNLLLTRHDSVVVADAGYPGTGDVTAGQNEIQNVALSGGTLSGTSEVQTVDISGGPTGGTFTLTYDGNTTAALPFDASASQVQTEMEALPNVTAGDVAVSGGPLPGSTVTVTFDAALGNVTQITGDGTNLTGGTTPAVDTATTVEGEAPVTGTFTLTYDGETTAAIPVGSTPAELAGFLTDLPNIDAGDIVVTGTAGDWDVEFDSELGNVSQMTADDTGLSGGTTPAITVTTTQEGAQDSTAAGLWAYATGTVAVRLSDVSVTDDMVATVNRETNRRRVIGERVFAAVFDPCVQLKVEAQALTA